MQTAFKRIANVAQWFGLMIFAMLVLLLTPIAFIIGIFFIFFRRKIGLALDQLGADLRKVSFTLDLLGNVTIFNWLWFLFKKKEGYHFGNLGETISFVLAKNIESETLTKFGKFWVRVILLCDKKHFDDGNI